MSQKILEELIVKGIRHEMGHGFSMSQKVYFLGHKQLLFKDAYNMIIVEKIK